MNYIITEEELTSLEKTGNPSYRKSVEYVIGRIRSRPVMPDKLLTELANDLSTWDDGVQYCDICDHCINPDKFDLRDHTKECLLHRIATSLTAQAEGGDKPDNIHICPECNKETNIYDLGCRNCGRTQWI